MTVLTYYNPTPAGQAALLRALDEAASASSALVVFNAPSAAAASADEQLGELLATAQDRNVAVELRAAGESSKTPLDLLVSESDRADVSLVVIGLARRSTVGKLLLGSVEQQILLRAGAPVLSLKGD